VIASRPDRTGSMDRDVTPGASSEMCDGITCRGTREATRRSWRNAGVPVWRGSPTNGVPQSLCDLRLDNSPRPAMTALADSQQSGPQQLRRSSPYPERGQERRLRCTPEGGNHAQ
jgi:hypothetical protein